MKYRGVLNPAVSELIAAMGHRDGLVITDAGMPVPPGVHRIDLALRCGIPSFVETLETVLTELRVEETVLAHETHAQSPAMEEEIRRLLPDVPASYISHEELKSRLTTVRGVIRTGECTPFSNVLLISGVIF